LPRPCFHGKGRFFLVLPILGFFVHYISFSEVK